MPDFTVQPAWCDVVWSFDVAPADGVLAVTFDNNQEVRRFTVFNQDRVDLAGSSALVYTITVKARSGIVTFRDAQAQFKLTLRNPCIDSAYVRINKTPLPKDLVYALYTFKPAPEGYKFAHSPYSVTTSPIPHNYCGDVHYQVWLDSELLSISSLPMAYNTISRTFEIYSEDLDLVGEHSITIQAHFADYPTLKSLDPLEKTTI